MDTKTLFQTISRRMRSDFEMAAQIQHQGSKGTVRENILQSFLKEGRLPSKYGVGAGEIVGRVKETSRQSDIIIYDKLNGVTLLYDDHTQVYPIDCVYGIIEVKSTLSKVEFIDSLDKIAAFKKMSPSGNISNPIGGGMNVAYPRPKPFGIVFAYNLSNNSLESLVANLREWETDKDPSLWPNYICVLETGVIYHNNNNLFEKCLDSDKIVEGCWPISLSFGEDSLWNFYSTLHDLCAHMKLGPVELLKYYEPSERIGPFTIEGRINFTRLTDGKILRPTESAISKIVTWCNSRGPIRYEDLLIKRFGNLPVGMNDRRILDREIYLYNPDDLPGLSELGGIPLETNDKGAYISKPSLLSGYEIVINDRFYCVCMDSLKQDDFEEIT